MKIIREVNLEYETELIRNPESPTLWLNYIHASRQSSHELWKMSLREQTGYFREGDFDPSHPLFTLICEMFEKALSNLGKMPRLWIMYLEFLIENRRITRTRLTINGALRALPITQHERIWDIVINRFIGSEDFKVPVRTSKRLLERYLQFEPEYADSVISFLIEKGDILSAVELLIKRAEEPRADSSAKLLLLIELISKNSNKLKSLEHVNLPAIIRTGIDRYPSKLGDLWNALSDYYIRLGLFSKAVDVYEEAMDSVMTVVDFSVIFEAYQNFLQLVVETKFGAGNASDAEIDLQRLELLIERRADLLSSVVLRQNPDNVIEWTKRAKLARIIEGGPDRIISVFLKAIQTVDPSSPRLVGRVSSLWIEFAKFHTSQGDLDSARSVFERAVGSNFKTVEDLASVWIEYILMELRLAVFSDHNCDRVLETARRAVSQYRGAAKGTVQSGLFRSVKLWALALDVEESVIGESKPVLVRAMYDSMMELKVITPQCVLNYAQFELDKKFFEKSIQVLEKALSIFSWPHCRDIWLFYISLVQRERKRFSTERVRDMFEQVLHNCDEKFSSLFYFCAFKFELDRGLASDAIRLLRRAASQVPDEAKAGFFLMAVSQSMQTQGAAATRGLFEEAISTLASKRDKETIEMCVEYCWMEAALGQTSRARKLLEHASQFANPNKQELEFFWDVWKNFEIQHGSEDTFKEMKRMQRSVLVRFSDKHFNTLDVGVADAPPVVVAEAKASPTGIDLSKLKQMAALKKAAEK